MKTRVSMLLVLWAGVALAQADSAKSAVRLRSSHTVDVIAPGEKVETVLDRMRSTSPRMERLRGEGRSEGARVRGPPGRGEGGPGGPFGGKEGRLRHGPGGGPPGAPRDGRNDGPPPPDRPRRPR